MGVVWLKSQRMDNKAISIKVKILKNIRNKRYYKKKDIRWGEKKERESENIKKKRNRNENTL